MRVVTLLLLLLVEQTAANPEPENGVIGQPEVRCGATSITVVTNTAAPFAGRLYVQGEAETEGCVRRPKGATDHVDFELHFGECGMRRQRTLSPRGVTYSFTLVVSFHPVFVTGTDRGFNVRCFFLETVKALEAEVDVGRLTTSVIEKSFDLPSCTYSIHEASPTGPPVKYARVGDAVAHVWNCGEEAAPAYGMLIHSCYVDDGAGKRFEVIDDRGCGVDRVLLPQIEYDRENLVASAKSSIFKYADKIQVFFTCTVQLCFKKDGGCDGLTPPLCDGHPHPPHPDHPVLLVPDHEHEHPDHHERPPHGGPEGHRGPPEGRHGPPPRPDRSHHPHDEDEEEEERRPPAHPRFGPRGGPPRPDSREHRGPPPPPHFPPRHGPPRGGEDREDGPREHGPPHRPREDRPDSRERHGPTRGDRDGPRGHFGPPRGGPRDEEEGERPPPPPRGLFPVDELPDEIKSAFESKFAPPAKEFFGPMERDSDLRLDSPLRRGGNSAEGEKLLALKSNGTTERKRPEVRVFSGNSVSSSTANSLDAALQAVNREEYSDDLDDIEALLNSSSDATSEPARYRTDFATSTLSTLFEDDAPPSTTIPSTTTTTTSTSESPSTSTTTEEEPLIRVSTMEPILKDAPPPSSTQYPFSSTGTIFEPLQERNGEREGEKLKQVGWDNDRTSRDSEARKKLETDLSVDVIVLPFEEDKPSTPSTLHSPPSLPSRPVLCLSAVGSSLLLSAVLLGLLVVAAVSFTIARRGRGSGRGPEPVASKRLDLF